MPSPGADELTRAIYYLRQTEDRVNTGKTGLIL